MIILINGIWDFIPLKGNQDKVYHLLIYLQKILLKIL
jgi:hypothetical protein